MSCLVSPPRRARDQGGCRCGHKGVPTEYVASISVLDVTARKKHINWLRPIINGKLKTYRTCTRFHQ